MILIISLFSSMSNEFMRSVMSSSFCNSMTAAHQAPLSVGFPRQEYWSGLPFPSPGDLPNTRIKPMSPAYRHSWPAEPLGKSPAQISHQIPISLRISVKILIVGHKTSDDIVLLNSWLHLLLSSQVWPSCMASAPWILSLRVLQSSYLTPAVICVCVFAARAWIRK